MPRWIAPALAVLSLACALWLGVQLSARQAVSPAEQPPGGSDDLGRAPDRVQDPATSPATRSTRASSTAAPLPAVGTPLAEVFDELVARADRGDDRAACRLALEMQACGYDLDLARTLAEGAARNVPVDMSALDSGTLAQMEAVVDYGERLVDHFETLAAHCKGAPEAPFGRQLGWWRQAALAGHPAAVHEYVGGEAFPVHLWIRESAHLTSYQRDLEALAWRTMRSGDVAMAWRLMNAHAPNLPMMRTDPLAQVVDVDAETALALALYLRQAADAAGGMESTAAGYSQLAQTQITELGTKLDAAGIERAGTRSREWLQAITPQPIESSPFERYRFGEEEGERRRQSRLQSCDYEDDA